MYRTPHSPTHAARPLLQMNTPLEIILIKVQSLFSSFACSGVSKGFFINLFSSILLCTLPLFLLFRLRQGTSGAEGWLVCGEVIGGCMSRLKAENALRRILAWQPGSGVIGDTLMTYLSARKRQRKFKSKPRAKTVFGLQVSWLLIGAANGRDRLGFTG